MSYRIQEDPPPPPSAAAPPAPVVPGVGAAAPVGKQIRPAGVVRIPARLVSLDAFRGFIMILLAAHGFGLAALARRPADSPVWKIFDADRLKWVAFHFDHPPWQSSFVPGTHDATVGDPWLHVGVSFWDLIQPAFMFMVGVAMPFSYARREKTGASALGRGWHALTRAAMLVLLGVFLYSLGKQSTNWIFPNVLAQIGLGYFFVYLLLGRKLWVQVGALVVILAGSWAAIHLTPPPANYEPAQVGAKYELGEVYLPPYRQWSKNGNAFSTFDAWFLNQFPRSPDEGPFTFNRGGYTTLNFVPSMATMLLGVLCGQLLLSPISPGRKLGTLVLLALVCWGLGVAAGATCCPVVKRVWTPGWALFSGGYVIGMLALFYLLFDIAPFRFLAFPLVVVGMNSLLVYVLGELLTGWLAENVNRHLGWAVDAGLGWLANTFQLLKNLDVPPAEAGAALHNALRPTVDATLAAGAIWLICLWLYRQKAFLRI